MAAERVIVVGGGIAGLAAAWHLSRAGRSVVVIERENAICQHSSGRNAAIFRQLEPTATLVRAARRQRQLAKALFDEIGEKRTWLDATGAFYVASRPDHLAGYLQAARSGGLDVESLRDDDVRKRTGLGGVGLHVADDGIIDIHMLTTTLYRACRRRNVDFLLGVETRKVESTAGRVTGVILSDGGRQEADEVVIAGGAWASELAGASGFALPLLPLRRHLVHLVEAPSVPRKVVWRVDDDEAYFRPDGDGVLASPCDEVPWPPGIPVADDRALALLGDRLKHLYPPLAQAAVRRAWACLRTFAPDRHPVAGPDPRCAGLFHVGGLGGHGMSMGLSVAEVLVDADVPWAQLVAPARLLEKKPTSIRRANDRCNRRCFSDDAGVSQPKLT